MRKQAYKPGQLLVVRGVPGHGASLNGHVVEYILGPVARHLTVRLLDGVPDGFNSDVLPVCVDYLFPTAGPACETPEEIRK
jgi:hypothetical protein